MLVMTNYAKNHVCSHNLPKPISAISLVQTLRYRRFSVFATEASFSSIFVFRSKKFHLAYYQN